MLRPILLLVGFCVWPLAVLGQTVPVSKGAVAAAAEDIRFVVMPDRTGGMRAGVFREALGKANLLHPEFVISVGDLIDGYTLDETLLDAQWKEFDAMVDGLDMPFYYVPGNHDISNEWMEQQWRERLGDPYYYFVYKDVLFLALHTEDGGVSGISEEQGRFFETVLAEHKEVRWTFLFMHRPLWFYEDQEGFERIGQALEGRRYTLLSGHHHNYYYEGDADGSERLILGTAGGGSALRGEAFGEFDHVTHVVLTADGPKITHLKLDGFVDKAVVNKENRSRVEVLRSGGFASAAPSVAEGRRVLEVEGRVFLVNPADGVLEARVRFPEVVGARFEEREVSVRLAAGERAEVPFRLLSNGDEGQDLAELPQLFLEVEGAYDVGSVSEIRLPSRVLWRVDWKKTLPRVSLEEGQWYRMDPPESLTEGWDWHEREDANLKFALRCEGDLLRVSVDVEDDVWNFGDGGLRDQLTLYFDSGDGERAFDFFPKTGGGLEDASGVAVKSSMEAEGSLLRIDLALPMEALGLTSTRESFRFNLRYRDVDRLDNQKPSSLYWKPRWDSSEDYEGAGKFEFVPAVGE